MKPRLQPTPLTEEDSSIWLSIIATYMTDWARVGVGMALVESDHRDADLMLEARLDRGANPFNPAGVWIGGIACGARWFLSRVSCPGYLVWK